MAQIKEVLDYYIEHAEEEGLTVRDVLNYVKTEFDLFKFCYDVMKEAGKGDKPSEPPKEVEGEVGGQVVAFSLKAE